MAARPTCAALPSRPMGTVACNDGPSSEHLYYRRRASMWAALYPISSSALCVSAPNGGGGVSMLGPPCSNMNAATGTVTGRRRRSRPGMLVRDPAMLELLVEHRFGHRPHPAGGDMVGLQSSFHS